MKCVISGDNEHCPAMVPQACLCAQMPSMVYWEAYKEKYNMSNDPDKPSDFPPGIFGRPDTPEPPEPPPPPTSPENYGVRTPKPGMPASRIGDESVEFEGRIEHETAKAYLIEPTAIGPEQCWLPKSQIIERRPSDNGNFIFVVTEWIARKNGLV
jgi:hypothetical protein